MPRTHRKVLSVDGLWWWLNIEFRVNLCSKASLKIKGVLQNMEHSLFLCVISYLPSGLRLKLQTILEKPQNWHEQSMLQLVSVIQLIDSISAVIFFFLSFFFPFVFSSVAIFFHRKSLWIKKPI